MKIFIKAKPLSREEKVEETEDGRLLVSVKEPPIQGRANVAIIRVLAEHYRVKPYQVRIVSGFSSREKVVEVESPSRL